MCVFSLLLQVEFGGDCFGTMEIVTAAQKQWVQGNLVVGIPRNASLFTFFPLFDFSLQVSLKDS